MHMQSVLLQPGCTLMLTYTLTYTHPSTRFPAYASSSVSTTRRRSPSPNSPSDLQGEAQVNESATLQRLFGGGVTERSLPQSPNQPEISVVDENPFSCSVAGDLSGVFGCTVTIPTSGEEAIAFCQARRFDAILMDVRMPGMSGLEAAQGLRRFPAAVSVPIIAVTGDGELFDGDLAGTGIVPVLLKPITM